KQLTKLNFNMKTKISWVLSLVFITASLFSNAQDIPPTTSLVYPGIDGKLVYKADSLGNVIPDFSNAGYKGGGVPIPTVAIKATIWPVLGDNAERIQKVIDSVSNLTPDVNGFRGAILLKMGYYDLEKPLNIKASGVVLRGEGMGETGTVLIGKIPLPASGGGRGFRRPALINIDGQQITPQEDTKQSITNNYVPVGAISFNVKSAKNFKKGDKVIVRRFGNEDWVKALDMKDEIANSRQWKFDINFDREIVNIDGNTITIDAPIF